MCISGGQARHAVLPLSQQTGAPVGGSCPDSATLSFVKEVITEELGKIKRGVVRDLRSLELESHQQSYSSKPNQRLNEVQSIDSASIATIPTPTKKKFGKCESIANGNISLNGCGRSECFKKSGKFQRSVLALDELKEERKAWDLERGMLEEQIIALEKVGQSAFKKHEVPSEKTRLKQSLRRLKVIIQSKDSCACPVCTHMQESVGEDQRQDTWDLEEMMWKHIQDLEEELNQLRPQRKDEKRLKKIETKKKKTKKKSSKGVHMHEFELKGSSDRCLVKKVVVGAEKDVQLIRKALRALSFFAEVDDRTVAAVVEVTKTFAFDDGDVVVIEGDTEGALFFIVAEGTFNVSREQQHLSTLNSGQSFGENVLFRSRERDATVSASGPARAYAVEATAVWEKLRRLHEEEHLQTLDTIDEMVTSNKVELLSNLNGYQLQCLYNSAELREFDDGTEVFREGTDLDAVCIITEGKLALKYGGAEFCCFKKYGIFVEKDGNVHYSAWAEGPTKMIALAGEVMIEMFGEVVAQALVQNHAVELPFHSNIFAQNCPLDKPLTNVELQEKMFGQELTQPSVQNCVVDLPLHTDILAQNSQLDALPAHVQSEDDADITFSTVLHSEKSGPAAFANDTTSIGDMSLLPSEKKCRVPCAVVTNASEAAEFVLGDGDKPRILKTLPICGGLSQGQIGQLSSKLVEVHLAASTTIFKEGDVGNDFYIIRKGVVSVETSAHGKQTLVRGDYFGEHALVCSEPRSATVTCMEESDFWKMDKVTYEETIKGPTFDHLKTRIPFQETKVELADLLTNHIIGGSGTLRMVTSRRTSVQYAIKSKKKRNIIEAKKQDLLVRERSILAEIDHPFIIKFVRSFKDQYHIYFLMEFVAGCSLLDALDAMGILDWSRTKFYAASIVLALEFLHGRRIAHLDLKSENCLIDSQGYLKLIDFGLAQKINGYSYAVCGTPMFMAPEVILGTGYTTLADHWSLGVCLYEFLIGAFPFADDCTKVADIFRHILKTPLNFPRWFKVCEGNQSVMEFLSGLLTRDPVKRLGACDKRHLEIKEHVAFSGFRWDDLISREISPPYIPPPRDYTENKENIGLHVNSTSDEEWVDPNPGWDVDF